LDPFLVLIECLCCNAFFDEGQCGHGRVVPFSCQGIAARLTSSCHGVTSSVCGTDEASSSSSGSGAARAAVAVAAAGRRQKPPSKVSHEGCLSDRAFFDVVGRSHTDKITRWRSVVCFSRAKLCLFYPHYQVHHRSRLLAGHLRHKALFFGCLLEVRCQGCV
jgi:hypothetical protein